MPKGRRVTIKTVPPNKDPEDDELCEYERQRLAHIQRNVEYMKLMGLLDAKEAFSQQMCKHEEHDAASKRPRQAMVPVPPEQLRRSERLQGKPPPNYTGPSIEELDRELERHERKPKKRQMEDKEEERREMIETSRRWLEESRKSLATVGRGKLPEKAEEWHDEAVRRWGTGVDVCNTEDWEAYVVSRLSKPPPPSPLDLLQEYYAHDTWQLLVACALMSRVSSWAVKHSCISAFFEKCPTPSAAISADHATLQEVLYPLGLFDCRLKTLIELSQKFLALPVFALDLQKFKIWGCGQFTVDSYHIFCRNEGLSSKPSDSTLNSFVAWLRKEHPNADHTVSQTCTSDSPSDPSVKRQRK